MQFVISSLNIYPEKERGVRKNMKKTNLLLALVSSAALLAGCNGAKEQYFGHGASARYAFTREGYLQTTVENAVVVTDLKGKITHYRLDTTQVTVELVDGVHTTKGALDNGDVKSKWELLEDYDMKKASPIEKEWYEQAEVFEEWVIGKTLEQVKAAVGEDNYLTDKATIGVTIHVNGFVEALELALNNKTKFKGSVGAVGVGGEVHTAKDWTTQAVNGHDIYVAGGVFDANKKVLAARIDTFQPRYAIEAEVGETPAKSVMAFDEDLLQIVVDESRVKGKHELKEDYNMKVASPIEKEWYEQAEALVALLPGKTVSEVLGTGENLENGADVGVTIKIAGYRATLLEAEHTAFNSRKPA